MINFRYHIVSLMAVFLALAVGIAVGVSLGPSFDQGLQQQAVQDRKQVTDLRAEIDRRNALDAYREKYDAAAGQVVTSGLLAGIPVALVSMPDAPTGVIQAVGTAVEQAGGRVVREVKIGEDAFDPTRAEAIDQALLPYASNLNLNDTMSQATKVGLALGTSIGGKSIGDRDATEVAMGKALSSAGLVSVAGGSAERAELILVVSADATTPAAPADLQTAHVQFDVQLRAHALGLVLAGPNSEDLDGTDVLAARSASLSADTLSTVDVADLASGVTTVVLAGKQQLLGGQGHYGALEKADAPLPALPLRS